MPAGSATTAVPPLTLGPVELPEGLVPLEPQPAAISYHAICQY